MFLGDSGEARGYGGFREEGDGEADAREEGCHEGDGGDCYDEVLGEVVVRRARREGRAKRTW